MAKVAFLIGKVSNIGGIGRVVSLLTESLIKYSDLDILIISYLKERSTGYNWNENIEFHHLIEGSSSMKLGIFSASMKLRIILKKNKVDTLISCGSLYGPLGVLGTLFSKTNLIYWDHSNYFENTSHKFKIQSKNFTAYFADVVVPLTVADKINYEKHTAAKKIIQIYNPIDSKLEDLQHEYNDSTRKIISVGRLKYQKNFLTLVDVAKQVFENEKNFQWHIYGSGPERDEIQRKITEYQLEDHVKLMGQSDQLYELYTDYGLMVMTSVYEGFPMTLLEGMANKLPLISFDIPTGPNEIIINEENGFLIEAFDLQEMAVKIIELLNNTDLRKKFSNKNTELTELYKEETITNQWINLLREVNANTH